jgi:hypothetical protein
LGLGVGVGGGDNGTGRGSGALPSPVVMGFDFKQVDGEQLKTVGRVGSFLGVDVDVDANAWVVGEGDNID